ncbi:MAG: hypothetical protein WCY24_04575, partial [Lutispora sp.]
YEKEMELNIQEPMLYFYRAATYLTVNKPNECLEDLKKAISMQPDLAKHLKENELFVELKDNKEFKRLTVE